MRILSLASMALLTVGGCWQAEIVQNPGVINSIRVGHFTTPNPVDDELIASYLRKELTRCGFQVCDDSPYILSGTIDVNSRYGTVREARIVLKKDSDQIIWSYEGYESRKEFARSVAEQIKKRLR